MTSSLLSLSSAASFLTGLFAKGLAVALVAALLVLAMRRAGAALRHHLLACSMGLLLALPLIGWVAPAWRVLPAWSFGPQPAASFEPADLPLTPFRDSLEVRANSGAVVPASSLPARPSAARSSSGQKATKPTARMVVFGWWRIGCLLIWAAGFVFLLSRLLVSALRLGARRHDSERWAKGDLRELFAECCRAVGVRRRVEVCWASDKSSAMTWGVASPVVLLPREALDWPRSRQRLVLLHELTHVRRNDAMVEWVSRLAVALHWWNPLAWWSANRLRYEREKACDDAVLQTGVARSEYADCLVAMSESCRETNLAGALAAAEPSRLYRRLLAILDRRTERRPASRVLKGAIVMAACVLGVPLAMAAVSRNDAKSAEQKNTRLSVPSTSTVARSDASQKQLTREELIAKVQALGGKVTLDTRPPGTNILAVSLWKSKARDADLASLRGFPTMLAVTLDLSKVGDAGMSHLADQKQLLAIYMHSTQVTDKGLKYLRNLTRLETLGLSELPITDAGIKHLAKMKNLQMLLLGNTKITDASCKRLAAFTRLTTLSLRKTRVGDAGVAQLKPLQALRDLRLYRTRITDAGMVHVNALRGLETLVLNETKITDKGLSQLTALSKMKVLYLTKTNITDASIDTLRAMKRLTKLSISQTRMTKAGVARLQAALPNCRIYH